MNIEILSISSAKHKHTLIHCLHDQVVIERFQVSLVEVAVNKLVDSAEKKIQKNALEFQVRLPSSGDLSVFAHSLDIDVKNRRKLLSDVV